MATLQYRSSSLSQYQGKKGTAARTRRRSRRESSRLLLNERLLIAQGLQEAQVTKYKLLGYLAVLPHQKEAEDDVEGTKLGTICAGLACTGLSTLLVGVMVVIHWGSPSVRCKLLPEEARGYNNPASVCYNLNLT